MEITTTIHASLLRKFLLRGTLIAGLGAFLLLLGGTLLPLHTLQIWGIPVMVVAFVLIAMGLVPYRRLAKKQIHPDKLLCEEEQWTFVYRGKPLFKIPAQSIDTLTFREEGEVYGLCFQLKRPLEKQISVMKKGSLITRFMQEGCDLFLPYFSKRAHTELIGLLQSPD